VAKQGWSTLAPKSLATAYAVDPTAGRFSKSREQPDGTISVVLKLLDGSGR